MKKGALIFITAIIIQITAAGFSFAETDAENISKTVKVLINSIRYEKYDMAAASLDFSEMAKILMQKNFDAMPKSDRDEMIKGIEFIIRRTTFVQGKKMFEHLSAVLHDAPRITNNKARCKTTVVVYKDYKKKEMIIDFELVRKGADWKIIDLYLMGEGMFAGIREDEVNPIIRESGIAGVMKAMRRKVAEVSKK